MVVVVVVVVEEDIRIEVDWVQDTNVRERNKTNVNRLVINN